MSKQTNPTEIQVFQDEPKLVQELKSVILSKIGDSNEFIPLANIQKIENKADYTTVSAGVKKIKKYISGTKNSRLEVTRQLDSFKKIFTDYEKELTEPAERILGHLEPILTDFEQAEERERQRIYQERVQLLTDNGYSAIGTTMVCGPYQLSGEQIEQLSDEDLEGYIQRGKQEVERQQELIRIQAEREAQIQKQMDGMQQKLNEVLERERIANEKLAEANRLLAETKAQEAALEHRYENPKVPAEPVFTAPPVEFDIPTMEQPQIIEFDLPPVAPAPTAPVENVSNTEPTPLDTYSYNLGLQDALDVLSLTNNEDGTLMTKKHYQAKIKELFK